MSIFNENSRTSNSLKTSVMAGISNIIKIILGFGYRTLFLYILTEKYLGINGLFSNILQMLSLAELGITTAIVYRFYEPISRNDIKYVGMLMNFFRKVYRMIACVIFLFGLCILPLVPMLINKNDQLPSDVNLYVVYLLFLVNTLSSYIFSYKLTLLSADQKHYIFSLIDLILTVVKYVSQIGVLLITRDYTLTIASGIVVTLIVNSIASIWVTKKYKEVFAVKDMLPKQEQKKIFNDTRACMYHKVGGTVLSGTDNAILTKFVNLTSTGLYSNYSMLLNYLQLLISQMLGNFTASVGNAAHKISKDDYYKLFRKLTFIDLWVTSVITICVYFLIGDFITLWLGEKYLLDDATTIIICIQLFTTLSRASNGSFINAAGLFIKDKIRPLIEAFINLVLSIILAKLIGIAGVFLGTIISTVLTVCWRDPYILYKYSFKKNVFEYWIMYCKYVVVTIMCFFVLRILLSQISVIVGWPLFIVKAIFIFVFSNIIMWIVFGNSDEFSYFLELIFKLKKKILK